MPNSLADDLLRRWLAATGESASAFILAELLEDHAKPLLRVILARKLYAHGNSPNLVTDLEDLVEECLAKLLKALHRRKSQTEAAPIQDFNGYVAGTAYNAYAQHCRALAPNRDSLKNKIRYLLQHEDGLEMWGDAGEIRAGLEKKAKPSKLDAPHLTSILRQHRPGCAQVPLRELVPELLQQAGGALTLDDVTAILAELWGVTDAPPVSVSGNALPHSRASGGTAATQEKDAENNAALSLLWPEIKELPYYQRAVLLYNLRDESRGEMVSAFFHAGLASLDELAKAFELTTEEFKQLLPRLPLTDEEIAAQLQLTPQQVGNLRRVARDYLRRRLAGKAKRNRT